MAVVVDSAQLAAQLADIIDEDRLPTRSWRIQFQPSAGSRGEPTDQVLTWTGEVNGKPITLLHEPMNFGKRLKVFFLSSIPGIDDQL